MHKIFYTPELLDEVFSYLSQHTHTVAARVYRLWFTHSIQFLWDLVTLDDILAVLSPFDELECYGFQHAALRQALVLRPTVVLFSSKLTAIQWTGPSEYLEYLLSLVISKLQILILQVELGTMKDLNTLDIFFKTIPLRSPYLRAFKFSFASANNDTQAISQLLGELCSLLSELVLILFPSHCMTEELFTTLSRLPQLQDLSLINWFPEFLSDDEDVGNLPKREIDDDEKDIPFCSLQKAKISDSDFMITEVLRRDIQLLKLVDLTYSAPSPAHTIGSPFFESLHRTCPNLKRISIFSYHDLPFQAIRSLLKCPALIEIVSDGDVDMKLKDIVTIATNRSSWRVINLPSVKALNYQALVHFAQNCPNLHKLGLTLDSTLGIPDLNTDVKFSSLTSLVDMPSKSAPDIEIAWFLSKICSKPIRILGYDDLWATVEKLVNSIITFQLNIRTLEGESMLSRTQSAITIPNQQTRSNSLYQ
ncbi:hypothetical protein Clacol_002107 [Clathrus columnatus]|uniref:F-box domain-containing protein n=1 Tax=Clathrus columnatus TaxID=1419009 RepID=A0AAV5A4D9_9AGAM|nr:hypothetical protein Clacol_002107 [Clathrus columnatus]